MSSEPKFKVIGSNGQITLGKDYAGHQVTVEQLGDENWLITGVAVIPKSELWLHEPATAAALTRAVRRAEAAPPRETDLGALEREIAARK